MLSALYSNYKAVDPSAARGFVEAYLGEYYYPKTYDLSNCFPEDSTLSNAMDTAIMPELGDRDIMKFLDAWKAIDASI